MIEFFQSGGVMMWPILACALLVLVLSVRAALALRAGVSHHPAGAVSTVDAVLFWGGLGAVLGMLGTVVGIAQMAWVLERFEGLSASTIWSGFRVTLTTSIAGTLILVVALLLWMGLRLLTARRTRTASP